EGGRLRRGPSKARGGSLLLAPGFVDLHAHLREPGFEVSETVASGARAALAGGFTTICAMPNTEPALDSAGLIAELLVRAEAAKGARVLPIGAITRHRAGKELADLRELADAGCVAFSDDGSPVADAGLFRSALRYAADLGRPISEHAQDPALAGKGVMHEGRVSAALGLPGQSAASEESAVARDIALARETGAHLHLAHVSTAGSVELVRRAKADGIRVTAEVTPHHLALSDEWVAGSRTLAWEAEDAPRAMPFDSATKVNPPLRTRADVRACWAGLADGTIDAIATDHAPHSAEKKEVEYDQAAFGISGFETAVPLVLGGVAAGWASLARVIAALTAAPASIIGRALPPDDWTLLDLDAVWTVRPEGLLSKGRNTPLAGRSLRGRAILAAIGGEVRYEVGAPAA
ncbi:MAG: dihydroorotase, partial [Chloroflexi bacterium]|nr:dihydroorotase [Chloroflexota bacterium]